MNEFVGKRVYNVGIWLLENGDYCYNNKKDCWYAKSPNGQIANLINHSVTENDDGTITVNPSIGLYYDNLDSFSYHGYLTKGIWKEC